MSEKQDAASRETPTPISTATASADRTLTGSAVTRTGMEISPDPEALPDGRKQIEAEQMEQQRIEFQNLMMEKEKEVAEVKKAAEQAKRHVKKQSAMKKT